MEHLILKHYYGNDTHAPRSRLSFLKIIMDVNRCSRRSYDERGMNNIYLYVIAIPLMTIKFGVAGLFLVDS